MTAEDKLSEKREVYQWNLLFDRQLDGIRFYYRPVGKGLRQCGVMNLGFDVKAIQNPSDDPQPKVSIPDPSS